MAARAAFLCLLLATGAGAGPGADAEPDPKADPAFVKGVNAAIDKGVGWLLAKQSAAGKFPGFQDARGEIYPLGMHALSTLVLLKAGRPVESPEVAKAFEQLEVLYRRYRNNLRTYEVGIVLMVLEAKYLPPPRAGKKGGKKRKKGRKLKVDAKDLGIAKQLVVWIQRKQKPKGLWRYPRGGADLSNTQYAALGLWAAHRLGVKIDRGVVRRMMEGVLKRQQKSGPRVPFILDPKLYKRRAGQRSASTIKARGWRYLPDETIKRSDGTFKKIVYPYSGSMTAAAIAILAIGRDILGDQDSWLTPARDRQVRTAMWEGLAWIQNNWELRDNPGQPGNWPFYWIYGLERAARLSGVEYIGARDWYYEGAERLVADQRPDGSWPKTQRMRPKGDQNVRWWSDQVDTCFALLFLTKSTPEIKTPPPTVTGGG